MATESEPLDDVCLRAQRHRFLHLGPDELLQFHGLSLAFLSRVALPRIVLSFAGLHSLYERFARLEILLILDSLLVHLVVEERFDLKLLFALFLFAEDVLLASLFVFQDRLLDVVLFGLDAELFVFRASDCVREAIHDFLNFFVALSNFSLAALDLILLRLNLKLDLFGVLLFKSLSLELALSFFLFVLLDDEPCLLSLHVPFPLIIQAFLLNLILQFGDELLLVGFLSLCSFLLPPLRIVYHLISHSFGLEHLLPKALLLLFLLLGKAIIVVKNL